MVRWTEENDRRLVYRIQDRARVEYRPLHGESPDALEQLFPPSPLLNLQNDLMLLDEEGEHLLRRIADLDRATAAYLRLLNRKIERIAQNFHSAAAPGDNSTITLSEEGLSFELPEPLPPGHLYALRLTLQPTGTVILARGRVRYHHPLADGAVRVGLHFVDLDDQYRHLIARHLIEHQARMRRQQRQEPTPP